MPPTPPPKRCEPPAGFVIASNTRQVSSLRNRWTAAYCAALLVSPSICTCVIADASFNRIERVTVTREHDDFATRFHVVSGSSTPAGTLAIPASCGVRSAQPARRASIHVRDTRRAASRRIRRWCDALGRSHAKRAPSTLHSGRARTPTIEHGLGRGNTVVAQRSVVSARLNRRPQAGVRRWRTVPQR